MIKINVTGTKDIVSMLNAAPKQARRALETALDATAKEIRDEIKVAMKSAFSNPVPWTLNSLKVTPTKGHNMKAMVGFKAPERMGQHYLVPMVEGGIRRLKGFEVATVAAGGHGKYDLAVGAKRTAVGNITQNQAKEIVAGVKRKRDYVVITKPHGILEPGVYQRFKTSSGFRRSETRNMGWLHQQGRRRGKFISAITARGLKPILIQAPEKRYKQRLDFYGIAHRVYGLRFEPLFWSNLNRFLPR